MKSTGQQILMFVIYFAVAFGLWTFLQYLWCPVANIPFEFDFVKNAIVAACVSVFVVITKEGKESENSRRRKKR